MYNVPTPQHKNPCPVVYKVFKEIHQFWGVVMKLTISCPLPSNAGDLKISTKME